MEGYGAATTLVTRRRRLVARRLVLVTEWRQASAPRLRTFTPVDTKTTHINNSHVLTNISDKFQQKSTFSTGITFTKMAN